MEIDFEISKSFSPLSWFTKGSCQLLEKVYEQVLINGLEDQGLNMTLSVLNGL